MGFSLSVYFVFVLIAVTIASYWWGIGPSLAVFVAICGICSVISVWLVWQGEEAVNYDGT